MHYKFLDSIHVPNVMADETVIISSFDYFRRLEEGAWGEIADNLEAASELSCLMNLLSRLICGTSTVEQGEHWAGNVQAIRKGRVGREACTLWSAVHSSKAERFHFSAVRMMTPVVWLASSATTKRARAKNMSLPSEVDVAIIGAGAAGLGAARALENSGLSVIVLEARDRVGGRAHTVQAAPDVIFDVGCGWLHSADKNSFVKIAEQLNFELDKNLPPWRERAVGNAFPQAERDDFVRALDEFYQSRRRSRRNNGHDSPANRLSRARQSLESDDRCDLDLHQRRRTRYRLDPRHGGL